MTLECMSYYNPYLSDKETKMQREIKLLVQAHSRWKSQDLNPGRLSPESMLHEVDEVPTLKELII